VCVLARAAAASHAARPKSFSFSFRGLHAGDAEAGRVVVTVFDANTLQRNVVIGAFAIDLAVVYARPHHEVFRQWVMLTDPAEEREGVQGYVKVRMRERASGSEAGRLFASPRARPQLSVVVLGPGDEQRVHAASEFDDEEAAMLCVLPPPRIVLQRERASSPRTLAPVPLTRSPQRPRCTWRCTTWTACPRWTGVCLAAAATRTPS
jgi:hypothetical protein